MDKVLSALFPTHNGQRVTSTRVVLHDRPGSIRQVMSVLAGCKYTILSSLLRRRGEAETAELEIITENFHRDAVREHARLVRMLLSKPAVRHLKIGDKGDKKVDDQSLRVFVAYDFSELEISRAILNELRDLLIVTGHCRGKDWHKRVLSKMKRVSGVLGLIPNRPKHGPSVNLLWEFNVARQLGIPGQWLVDEDVPLPLRPSGDNVIAFSHDGLHHALERAVAELYRGMTNFESRAAGATPPV